MDLIKAFGSRNIDGVPYNEIYEGVSLVSGVRILNEQGQQKRILQCVKEYFKPIKKYYKFTDKSDCSFVRHAMGIDSEITSCVDCFRFCIEHREKK